MDPWDLCFISPGGTASLGPTFRNHCRTDIPPQWSRNLNLTKCSPLPNSYRPSCQAFFSSSQASELWPQAWERAFNKMCLPAPVVPQPVSVCCLVACLISLCLLALLSPPYKRKGFSCLVLRCFRDSEIWVCTLLQQPFWIKSLLTWIQICFYWQSLSYWRLRASSCTEVSPQGEKITHYFGFFVCRQQTDRVWPPPCFG